MMSIKRLNFKKNLKVARASTGSSLKNSYCSQDLTKGVSLLVHFLILKYLYGSNFCNQVSLYCSSSSVYTTASPKFSIAFIHKSA